MFEGFSIIFLSILFEAIPFVIIGAIVSSIIEVFITPNWIANKLPKNRFLGYIFAGLMGIVFPVCECAIVPIVRRLVKKGTPVGLAITFMMAVPIVNPVVLMSTSYAFNGFYMAFSRGLLGFIGALIIGFIFDKYSAKQTLKDLTKSMPIAKQIKNIVKPPVIVSLKKKVLIKKKLTQEDLKRVIRHTNIELYEVGRFLILGAFISATMQTFIPRIALLQFGNHKVLSILFMMMLAFILSLCSEADAFIASSFRYQFTSGSLIAFLIFGPMIDIKNTLMLLGAFNKKFVLKLIAVIFAVCFSLAMLFNFIISL